MEFCMVAWNLIVKKCKLFRFATVFKYCRESWKNSAFAIKQDPSKNRLLVYVDLLYWFVFYGNDFNDYCTFEFGKKSFKERKAYISLRRNNVLCRELRTPEVHDLFLDKAAFNERFRDYIKRGWLTTNGVSWEEILKFVDKYKRVIVKPLKDSCGHGIFSIDTGSPDFLDKLKFLEDSVSRGDMYIMEEIIKNHEDIRCLAPGSLNTIRAVTVIDKNKELHIVALLLRMGNGDSLTDNYHTGGMACPIDLEKGVLSEKAYGMLGGQYDTHPYSRVKFAGYPVPDFARLLSVVREIVQVEPEARYVGWDLVITPDGIELLEGNIPPGEDITQIATGKGLWYQMQEWM